MERIETDIVVVGAGIVGLAIAERLSQSRDVFVLERHRAFGQETSSRNSEVVHSGIYYPKGSEKTRHCLRGRELLYAFCAENDVGVSRCGKHVIARSASESSYLETLAAHASSLGVACEPIDAAALREREPAVRAETAIYFPDSGIVDTHQMMAACARRAESRGAVIAYNHQVLAASADGRLEVSGPEGAFELRAQTVINSAGLSAVDLAHLAHAGQGEVARYSPGFCRGRYFFLSGRWQKRFRGLVYPVPEKDGLGVHVTLDLAGGVKIGPDVDWLQATKASELTAAAYDADWDTLRPAFLAALQSYCPDVEADDIQPGYIGIRPKLFRDGGAIRDFATVRQDAWVHLLGIESPGVTASLSLAETLAKTLTGKG